MRRRWTPEEDAMIRSAAAENQRDGYAIGMRFYRGPAWERSVEGVPEELRPAPGFAARLKVLARKLGRTYAAVQQRAHRIGARSKNEPADNRSGCP